jgi:hypothetical protein
MVAAAVAQSQVFVAGKVAARPRAQRVAPVAAMQQSERQCRGLSGSGAT